ncbi:RidA family protein [Phycicoccus sp. CSK15P-2]|uniref:RidA family protein n=1 Tax=Phycicoccus sp. CSK15P-2 TaxID=2807627 RepID=UPI00194DC734|nr:RidA family protein [Phycicoccus sp. CSK15P-2]MBM6402739.1 RidA family protein [Phycicoccus sp. CSK15P-2]
MSVTLLSPHGLMQPVPYHHVAVATGSRHVHVAGQVARDPGGRTLAPDLRGQVAHALRNTARGLAGAEAGFADVVRLTFYVTRWSPDQVGDLLAGVADVAEELAMPHPMPPASLVGVEHLFEPDVRVEVEATAVVD